MLTYYQTVTAQLLQNPPAPSTLYSAPNLTTWINIARGQIAGEGEAIRAIGTVSTVIGQRAYPFSGINIGTPTDTGIQGVLNVRRIQYNVGTGQKWIKGKSWEWFDFQRFNNPVPASGPPTEWAQYAQGSAGQNTPGNVNTGSGSFYIDPLPDLVYTLNCDCVCYPQPLAVDADVEALPYLWTDAVPYYAAYMALLSSQTSTRMQQAQTYFQIFEQFVSRARGISNPPLNNFAFEQSADIARTNRFGVSSGGRNAS